MKNRQLYNSEIFEKMCLFEVNIRNPGISDEQLIKKAKSEEVMLTVTKQCIIADLAAVLFDEYEGARSRQFCREKANDLVNNIPAELLQNINEWLDEKPLSDIKVHGISPKDIIESQKQAGKFVHFIEVLECFIEWRKNDYFNEDFCWRYFASL